LNAPIPLSVRPRNVPLPIPLTVRKPPAETVRPAPVKPMIELEPTFMRAMVVEARVDEARVADESVVCPDTLSVPVNEAALEMVWPLIAPLVSVPFKIWLPETFRVPIEVELVKKVVAVRIDEEALPKRLVWPVTPRVDDAKRPAPAAKKAPPVWLLVPEIVVEPAAVVKPGATRVVPSKVKVVEVAKVLVAEV
jgi:hypothetical protein